MSRWFRHYAGMMRDEKLVRVAVRAKQPVERVVWVWGALLESAAEINDGGRFEFDTGEAAYFLRCDDTDLGSILTGLESLGRISGGMVAKWGERQYDSDGAKERQRRYRERIKSKSDVHQRDSDHNVTQENVTRDVTQPSRDGVVTLQETETETYNSAANARANDVSARMPELYAALGVTDEAKLPGLLVISEPINWAVAGCDIDADILPALRSIAARRKAPPRSWSYCSDAVFEARDRRLAPAPAVQPRAAAPPKPKTVGEMFREDARQMGVLPNDQKPTSTPDRRLGDGNGSGQSGGSGIARRFALPSNILGDVGSG